MNGMVQHAFFSPPGCAINCLILSPSITHTLSPSKSEASVLVYLEKGHRYLPWNRVGILFGQSLPITNSPSFTFLRKNIEQTSRPRIMYSNLLQYDALSTTAPQS